MSTFKKSYNLKVQKSLTFLKWWKPQARKFLVMNLYLQTWGLLGLSAFCFVKTSPRCHSQRSSRMGLQEGQHGDHLGGKTCTRQGVTSWSNMSTTHYRLLAVLYCDHGNVKIESSTLKVIGMMYWGHVSKYFSHFSFQSKYFFGKKHVTVIQ